MFWCPSIFHFSFFISVLDSLRCGRSIFINSPQSPKPAILDPLFSILYLLLPPVASRGSPA